MHSSKDPVWISKHVKSLKKPGNRYGCRLIYKTTEELANSFYKINLRTSKLNNN